MQIDILNHRGSGMAAIPKSDDCNNEKIERRLLTFVCFIPKKINPKIKE